MTIYIGLDVHSKSTTYVAQDSEGAVIGKGKVATSARRLLKLPADLGAPEGSEVGLETGTQATWVARLLAGAGMRPVVIDARQVRTRARRRAQKSDNRDAFEICDGLRRGIYEGEVFVPSPEVERLRRVLSRRRFFVRSCTRNINAAKYLLRSVGLSETAGSLCSRAGRRRLAARPEVEELRSHLWMHARAWLRARRTVERLDAEPAEALEPFAREAELLQTTPGVGPITSATFISALAQPERFPTSSHVVSYLGLAPSSYDTGERQRRGHITRSGPPQVRAALCESTHHAARASHPLNPYWRRVFGRGGYRKAVVAVAARLARILWAMWRRGECFNVDRLNVELSPHTVKRTYIYRLKRSA